MAIRVNQKDIKSVMCPAVGGVREEAQAVRIHNGSAWVDVWSNLKLMTLLSNSISKGMLAIYDDGSMQYSKTMSSGSGTMGGGGTITFYLDGEWVNPTLSFGYEGLYLYETSTGNYSAGSAGSISMYHRAKGSSSAGTTTILSRVGGTSMEVDNGVERGTTSKTITGTYDRLGISFTVPNYGSYSFATLTLAMSDIKIGEQSIGFPKSAEFYLT